jgi:hypothetical protein
VEAEPLRASRCLEVLERIGSPEGRAALEAVARGAPQAQRTREALASLGRLEALAKQAALP